MNTGDCDPTTDAPEVNTANCHRQNAYKNSFFPKTIQDWDRLPAQVTDFQTIEEFRVGLGQLLPIP